MQLLQPDCRVKCVLLHPKFLGDVLLPIRNYESIKRKNEKNFGGCRCGNLSLVWFYPFSNHAGAEAHAAGHGHEHEHEEVDFDNIPLSQKQVDAVDLKMGEAVDRVMDATIAANGQLVLRAQNKGDVASLMGAW